ncbi:hypothetical protein Syun_022040 [Stephania yunnanensis]|uniref:Chlororespiratory reduction 3 n=1 Tax=Stephania yunnanensis TaxID=152371 RepID=A0AAP0IGW3_9MAGN
MVCSSYFSTPTTSILQASSLHTNNNNNNSSLPTKNYPKIGLPRSRIASLTPQNQQKQRQQQQEQQQQQPSLAEIERAIGASSFGENDSRGFGKKSLLFDLMSSSPIGQPEGEVERRLRETGEWIIETTEGDSPSSGHNILMVVSLGILPVWLLCLAVASGLLKLPFSSPALDNLLM